MVYGNILAPNLTCVLHRPLMLPTCLPATRTAFNMFNDCCRAAGIAISSKTTPTWCLVDLCTQDLGLSEWSPRTLKRKVRTHDSVLCKFSRAVLGLPVQRHLSLEPGYVSYGCSVMVHVLGDLYRRAFSDTVSCGGGRGRQWSSDAAAPSQSEADHQD